MNPGNSFIINRNVGSPSTINILLTFPTPSSLDVASLTTRLAQVQELWPLLCVAIVDQRTTRPKFQHRHSVWETQQILASETYVANTDDPQAERDGVYDTAMRLFQTKVSYDRDPLWRVTIFRASSDAEQSRLYLALTVDHVIIDGRGAVKLAQALVAHDITQLPKEDVELYEKAYNNSGLDKKPPHSTVVSFLIHAVLYPRLPVFVQRWLGHYPHWPQKAHRPTINSPWKSSVFDVPADLMQKLKVVGKSHGIATLNPTLHTAWVVALWAVLVHKEPNQIIRDCSIKDLRDVSKGDPYCVGGHATIYVWSSGVMTARSRFWKTAHSYAAVSIDPKAHTRGLNMVNLSNLLKDGPMDPETSKYQPPDSLELPAGDKRAHTLREEDALKKINSMAPYTDLSGSWSNISYVTLPKGATDMVFGVSGKATGIAFNTCVVGHENGARFQNAYSDGAAMSEEEVKQVEKVCLDILKRITSDRKIDEDWCLSELINNN